MTKVASYIAIIIGVFLSNVAGAAPGCSEDQKRIFSRPLILGASCSAGFGIKSFGDPGTRAARTCNSGANIKNIAVDGKAGADSAEEWLECEEEQGEACQNTIAKLIQGRTVVIALDFLFWDTAYNRWIGDGKAAFDLLLAATQKAGIPLVIGDVPALPGDDTSAVVAQLGQYPRLWINPHIHRNCTRANLCYLLPFVKLHSEAKSGQGALVEGQYYKFEQIMQDDLRHFNQKGSTVVGQMLLGLFKR